MANTASNVRVGVTGAVYYAALGTTLPSTLTASVSAFTELGYVNEDGITESQPVDNTDVNAWQNGDIVRTIQSSHDLTYQFMLLETSTATQSFFYGGDPLTATPYKITGEQLDHHAMVIDVLDGSNKRRICIPDGQVVERGDVVYSGNDPVGYEVTVRCFPDSSGTKAYVYEGKV